MHHLGSYGHCAPAYFYPSYGYYGAYGYGSLGGYLWRGPTYTVGYDYWAPVAPYEGSRDTEHARGDTRSRARRDLATLQARALRAFNARRAAESGGSGPKVVTPPKPEDGKRARQIGVALGRGDKAFEAGRYREAREEYVGALVLAGDDASVRIALGLAEYALGAYADASQAIRRGVAASPRLAASGFDLKQVYGREADFEAHRTALVNFVEQHPADLEARFLLGFVHYFSGQRPAALESFEGYTASPAHDPTVEPFIGLARASKRQPDTGKED
ncbi:MAG: tetratricopeptide repeat protein [Phycisphaerae bacterium]